MKKFVISILILVMLIFPTTTVAFADAPATNYEYYKILSDGVLFGEEDSTGTTFIPKFEIPNTYYAKIDTSREVFVDINNISYEPVIYKGQKGYIKTAEKDIKYAKATGNIAKLNDTTAYYEKQLPIKKNYINGDINISANTELDYLGKLTIRNEKNYVFLYNNSYVMIPATEQYFDNFVVPTHSFPIDNNTNVTTDEKLESPYTKLSTNILTIGIAVACIVMVIIIYKPRKKMVNRNEYDDDYYDNYKSKYNAKNNR